MQFFVDESIIIHIIFITLTLISVIFSDIQISRCSGINSFEGIYGPPNTLKNNISCVFYTYIRKWILLCYSIFIKHKIIHKIQIKVFRILTVEMFFGVCVCVCVFVRKRVTIWNVDMHKDNINLQIKCTVKWAFKIAYQPKIIANHSFIPSGNFCCFFFVWSLLSCY